MSLAMMCTVQCKKKPLYIICVVYPYKQCSHLSDTFYKNTKLVLGKREKVFYGKFPIILDIQDLTKSKNNKRSEDENSINCSTKIN